MLGFWLRNWRHRHRHPVSLGLHAIAIPILAWAGYLTVVQLWDGAWSLWWRPLGLLVLSYGLQWIGHRVEGNEMGEVILIKKWIGKPYVSISPRYERTTGRPPSSNMCQP